MDLAGVLKPEDRASLEAKLKAHEDKTSDQVVVATLRSLGAEPVEDAANRLFRGWGIGTKAKNNGVLVLVAPNDRKVRVEVGYGLEGALTDAVSSVIIRTAMTPRFKAGDFAGGIGAGVDAILNVLSGDADEWHRRAAAKPADGELPLSTLIMLAIFVIVALWIIRRSTAAYGGAYRRRNGSWIVVPGSSGGWSGGFGGGGGFSGGGFSGGGGSSGGGGASGSW